MDIPGADFNQHKDLIRAAENLAPALRQSNNPYAGA
jgi:hypothetical protein